MKKFAVFDIDWTLHPSALGTEFYTELGLAGLIPHDLEQHLQNWKTADDCGAYFMEHFYPLADELVGLKRTDLEAVGQVLAKRIVPTIFPELHKIIEGYRAEGRVLLAITSSPQVVAEPLAKLLGLAEVRSSKFIYDDDGIFVGAYHRTDDEKNKGKVLTELVEKHHLSWQDSAAYGDSIDDVSMLEYVSQATVVNPKSDLAEIARTHQWNILNTT